LTDFTLGRWYHFAGTFDGRSTPNSSVNYIDGRTASTSSDDFAGMLTNTNPIIVSATWLGSMDEVRISKVARSENWMATGYRNQSDPTSFYDAATPEELSDAVGGQEPSITLASGRAVSFKTLTAFSHQATGEVQYQLSNDAGKTWYWFDGGTQKWQKTTEGRTEANLAEAIAEHANSFPRGKGKLLWRAYPQLGTLTQVAIDYVSDAVQTNSNSLTAGIMPQLNDTFGFVHGRIPTFVEWEYWARRILNGEKETISALKGAMEWQELFVKNTK
jgi:hypothetical protein